MMFDQFKRQLFALLKNKDGSPALEFALVAPVFFLIIFSAMELGRGLYENNRFGAAAAIATRTVALDASASVEDVKNAILAKLVNYEVDDLEITIADNETIAGQEFKKIEIGYDFNFLVSLGNQFDGIRLETTRFAPVAASSGGSGSDGSDGGGGDSGGGDDDGDDGGDDEEPCVAKGKSGKCK